MIVIGVSGYIEDKQGNRGSAGAGKDTVADHLVAKHGFVKVALADEIKRTAMRWWGFSEHQLWSPSEERNKPDPRYPLGGDLMRSAAVGMRVPVEYLGCLTPRHALQQIGTEVARAIDPNVWVRYVLEVAARIERMSKSDPTLSITYDRMHGPVFTTQSGAVHPKGIVVSDVRFPNEIDAIAASGGKVWRKKRLVEALPSMNGSHVSETLLLDRPDSDFDAVFPDGDLDHLGLLIDRVMDLYSGRIIPYDEEKKDIPPFKR